MNEIIRNPIRSSCGRLTVSKTIEKWVRELSNAAFQSARHHSLGTAAVAFHAQQHHLSSANLPRPAISNAHGPSNCSRFRTSGTTKSWMLLSSAGLGLEVQIRFEGALQGHPSIHSIGVQGHTKIHTHIIHMRVCVCACVRDVSYVHHCMHPSI